MDSCTVTLWSDTFPVERVSGLFLLLPYVIETPVLNANSVDSDWTPHSAASDLSLHCLPMSLLWEARHKWVNNSFLKATPEGRISAF